MIIFNLESDEEILIDNVAKEMGKTNQNDKVFLKPLSRFGKSGARLFFIHVRRSNDTVSLSRIAKLDTVKKLKREKEKTKSIIHDFKLRPEILYDNIEDKNDDKKAIILYKIEGDKELKDLLESCTSGMSLKKTKFKKVISTIKIVMKGLPNPSTTPSNKQINDAFNEYLRGGAGFEKIKQYANNDITFPYIKEANWEKLINKINKFLNDKISLNIGAIHGDLHPSNIMIDTENNYAVNLIDFAWAKIDGISAVDYAMMENSIQYMWAPHWLPEYFWDKFNFYSLEEYETWQNSKKTFLKSLENEEYLKKWGKAIWDIIKIIRKYANARKISHQELLAARIALLLGQAKFDDYPPVRVGAQLWRLLVAWEKELKKQTSD